MKLHNYLDLLIDNKIDAISRCPICLGGASHLLEQVYRDLKELYKGTHFQKLLKSRGLFGIYHWKGDWHPIPLVKLKQLLTLWQEICHKNAEEAHGLYNRFYEEGTHLKAGKSPNGIRLVHHLDSDLAYLLGVLFADGSLRDIWLTKKNKGRFVYEITITDALSSNINSIRLHAASQKAVGLAPRMS